MLSPTQFPVAPPATRGAIVGLVRLLHHATSAVQLSSPLQVWELSFVLVAIVLIGKAKFATALLLLVSDR